LARRAAAIWGEMLSKKCRWVRRSISAGLARKGSQPLLTLVLSLGMMTLMTRVRGVILERSSLLPSSLTTTTTFQQVAGTVTWSLARESR